MSDWAEPRYFADGEFDVLRCVHEITLFEWGRWAPLASLGGTRYRNPPFAPHMSRGDFCRGCRGRGAAWGRAPAGTQGKGRKGWKTEKTEVWPVPLHRLTQKPSEHSEGHGCVHWLGLIPPLLSLTESGLPTHETSVPPL